MRSDLRRVYTEQARIHNKKSDKSLWRSALFCSRVVGKYEEGASRGLANDLGVSPDTVEDRAHGYAMFEQLCKMEDGKFRLFVFQARRLPYVHFSHFRALWDVKKSFDLDNLQVLNLLTDIVHGEGDISSRDLANVVRGHYGKDRTWQYYVEKTRASIEKTIMHKNTPPKIRKALKRVIGKLPKKEKV